MAWQNPKICLITAASPTRASSTKQDQNLDGHIEPPGCRTAGLAGLPRRGGFHPCDASWPCGSVWSASSIFLCKCNVHTFPILGTTEQWLACSCCKRSPSTQAYLHKLPAPLVDSASARAKKERMQRMAVDSVSDTIINKGLFKEKTKESIKEPCHICPPAHPCPSQPADSKSPAHMARRLQRFR